MRALKQVAHGGSIPFGEHSLSLGFDQANEAYYRAGYDLLTQSLGGGGGETVGEGSSPFKRYA